MGVLSILTSEHAIISKRNFRGLRIDQRVFVRGFEIIPSAKYASKNASFFLSLSRPPLKKKNGDGFFSLSRWPWLCFGRRKRSSLRTSNTTNRHTVVVSAITNRRKLKGLKTRIFRSIVILKWPATTLA